MSREIKFRAKVADSDYENEKQSVMIGSFVHFTGFIGLENDIGYVEQLEEIHGVGWFDVDLKTLGQYTGLKDKNSKEIFNGDIVERKGIKYQITLEIGSFLLVKIDENTDMYEEFVDCWNDHVYPLSQLYWNNSDEENHIYDLEVIGNIYENPELLEATA